MSNDLEFQLFVGLPLDKTGLNEADAEKYGLDVEDSGEKKFIGRSVGEPVCWDGEWAQDIGLTEFEELKRVVEEGFRKAGKKKTPELFFLAKFS
jgi:hypothetical protein